MTSFLASMEQGSRERVRAAKARVQESSLWARAMAAAAPPPLALSPRRFDVIAEIKPKSPVKGVLGGEHAFSASERAAAYSCGGACAISVLTEPARFSGSLDALRNAALHSTLPTMRKDFLVDPYQVLEARQYGAAGVLLIVPLLPGALLSEMLAAANAVGLFALVEVFDERHLEGAVTALAAAPGRVLLGVNARDLVTMTLNASRHAAIAAIAPAGFTLVAESGIDSPGDAARVARLGYTSALVGSALMQDSDPRALLAAMIESGRAAIASKAAS